MTREYSKEYMVDYDRARREERLEMQHRIDEALGKPVFTQPTVINFDLNRRNKNCFKVCGNKSINTDMIIAESRNSYTVQLNDGTTIEVKHSWIKNWTKVDGVLRRR